MTSFTTDPETCFDLTEVQKALALIARLNSVSLKDLRIIDGKEYVVLDDELIVAWGMVGLNNSTLIQMDAWKEPVRSEVIDLCPTPRKAEQSL